MQTPREAEIAFPHGRERGGAARMPYGVVVDAYRNLEASTGRLLLIATLADLFRHTPAALLPEVVYLCQGKLAPDFAGVQLGLAEKLTAQAVAESSGANLAQVTASLRRTGDLGSAAEQLLAGRDQRVPSTLDVHDVFQQLKAVAVASGPGAQRRKLSAVAGLLRQATPAEARYLVRTVTGKLRLGIGDATILDALADVYGGGRRHRPALERAYNICSDLGLVAATVANGGLVALARMTVRPGHPVRPMLAQRLSSPKAILKRFGGTCAAEYKYDGERVQIHRQGSEVTLFSRRLTRITDQYPDAVALVRSGVRPRAAILEAEIVAVAPESGEPQPFQELMHRRRRYGVAEAMQRYPVGLFAFDLLSAAGQDLTNRPYRERRKALAEAIVPSARLTLTIERLISAPRDLQAFFEEAITDGSEGLMCKSVAADSVYQAGARGWLWIKYKREYQARLQDTLDLVVVGAFYGRGKRRGRYGALLLAAYDARAERFATVTKVGTGFSDKDLATLAVRLAPHRTARPSARVDARITADVWFEPALVLEVIGAEITLSPVHTAGWGRAQPGTGLALRFPRFTGRVRDDKSPEDATTVDEILRMFRSGRQRRKGALRKRT
jgi:DNA ligase-1